MLSKAQWNELSTLHCIHKGDTTIDLLSKQLAIPKNTIKSYIYKLNETLDFQLGVPEYLQTSKQGIISVHSSYKKNSSHFFNQLKLIYLKQSHEFNIMIALATHSTLNYQKLTKLLVLSRSYVSRLVKRLNKKIYLFGFQIVEHDESLYLQGNEVSIRLYLYLLLSDSFQTIEWPFDDVGPNELKIFLPTKLQKTEQNISHTKKTFIHILFAVLQNRLKRKQILPPPKKAVNGILNLIQQNFDVTTEFPMISFDENNLENQTNEKLYFNFFIRLFVADIIPSTDKIQLGKTFDTSVLEITVFAQKLTAKLQESFDLTLSKSDYYLFIYYLTLLCTFYQIFGDSSSAFIHLRFQPKQKSPKKNETQRTIESIFHDFCSTFSTSLVLPSPGDSVDQYFCETIYHLLDMCFNPKLLIYVQLSQEFTAELFVIKKLKTIFNSNTISITDDFSKADLLITDTAELPNERIPSYHLSSLVDLKQWNGLLSLIQTLILEKFFIT